MHFKLARLADLQGSASHDFKLLSQPRFWRLCFGQLDLELESLAWIE